LTSKMISKFENDKRDSFLIDQSKRRAALSPCERGIPLGRN
jgi:hypothetical protein